jgi:hypothetical protein
MGLPIRMPYRAKAGGRNVRSDVANLAGPKEEHASVNNEISPTDSRRASKYRLPLAYLLDQVSCQVVHISDLRIAAFCFAVAGMPVFKIIGYSTSSRLYL